MRTFILFSLIVFLCSSCNLREREQALDNRAAQLDQKEQELLLKEKSLQLKQEELQKKQQQFDSTTLADTLSVYDPNLLGTWAVKMVCTEATCPGSAVGDIKNETWQISYQDKNILVRAMTGTQLVRVYSGTYNGSVVELTEDRESQEVATTSKMTVRLRIIDRNTLEGQREIIREGSCRIVYSVNMTRQS